jgi:hypothetical protein
MNRNDIVNQRLKNKEIRTLNINNNINNSKNDKIPMLTIAPLKYNDIMKLFIDDRIYNDMNKKIKDELEILKTSSTNKAKQLQIMEDSLKGNRILFAKEQNENKKYNLDNT